MTDKIEWGKEAPWNAVYHAGEGCEIWQQTPCGADVLIAEVSEDAVSFGPAIAEVPAMVAALRGAKQFIENGIEFGFIRMPDADTPDAAHDMLPTINAILSRIDGGKA